MSEAVSSANADKALEAMGRMFNEVGTGDLTDYQRSRFEQLAIGFLGSGGEPEMQQEWLEKADRQFGLTRGRVEVVRQMAEKSRSGSLNDDDQVGLARSLIVLRLFPGKLKQIVGDLIRENPDGWQDMVKAVSLSLTNPKAGEGFSSSDPRVFARAAERTEDYFEKEVNEVVGQPAEPEIRARKVMRRLTGTGQRETEPPAEPPGPPERQGSSEREGEMGKEGESREGIEQQHVWLINSLQEELLLKNIATEGLVPSLPVSVDEARQWLGAPDRDKVLSGMRYLAVFGGNGDRQKVWDLDKKLRIGGAQLNLLNILTVRFMEIYSRSTPKEYRGQVKALAEAIRREVKLLALISPVMLGLKQSGMKVSGVSVDSSCGAPGVNKVVGVVLELIDPALRWEVNKVASEGGSV